MKVAIIHNAYRSKGGEDVCVENEAMALKRAGLEVSVHVLGTQGRWGAMLDASLSPWGAGQMAVLERLLDQEMPDIVHAHNLFPRLSPRLFHKAKQRGCAIFLTLHNFRPICLNGLFLTPKHEICERCTPGNYRPGIVRGCYRGSRWQSLGLASHLWASMRYGWYQDVDVFIAPGEFLKEKYKAFAPFRNKIVIQGHFSPDEHRSAPVPAQPYALYMGRLSQEKGVRWILERFKQPPVPVKLILAGDGPMKAEVINACGPHVEYRGYVEGEQKERLLRQASVLLLPSECYENFPLSLMEAGLRGVPVLATAHGGIREHLRAGVNGECFPLHDTPMFWTTFGNVHQQSQDLAYRRACQDYAREQFSEKRFIDARLALYRSACAGSRRGL